MSNELPVNEEEKQEVLETPNEQQQEQPKDTNIQELLADTETLDKYDTFEEFVQAQEAVQTTTEEPVVEPEKEATESNSEEETPSVPETQKNLSAEEFMNFVTSEFKANGQKVKVDNPEDIRQLMQYGMNYHKKMAELAPKRRILKALEQHGLVDESKVNFAIELLNGKPEAIAQLLKQHEVDTYNLPDLEDTPYQANDYLPNEAKLTFDETVDELRSTEAGKKAINFIAEVDASAFQKIFNNPNIARNIADDVDSGLFDEAQSILATEKALGKVPSNFDDVDAYAYIATHLRKTKPELYDSNYQQPKIIGNNKGKVNQPVQNNAKHNAGIPNGQVTTPQQHTGNIEDLLRTADLSQYDTWEQFVSANLSN